MSNNEVLKEMSTKKDTSIHNKNETVQTSGEHNEGGKLGEFNTQKETANNQEYDMKL